MKQEGIRFSSLPVLQGIETVCGNSISNEIRPHIHKTYIIGIVEQGKRVIKYSDEIVTIPQNDIFIINPGQVHSCGSGDQTEHSYKFLCVNPASVITIGSQISGQAERGPYFGNIHYSCPDITRKIRHFFAIHDDSSASTLEKESLIYSILTETILAFADYPPPIYDVGKQNASVERVCNFIRKHYSENLSLGELSKIACLSPFHFQRVFTKEIGISPHNYLMHYRIGKARKKLLKTGYIAETATETGFADQSHFSKKFKQIVGINPGRYLKISL